MEKSLSGKTALVTGSTSGLGKDLAVALAQAGCRVALNGFGDRAEIEALQARLISDYGVDVFYHGANLMIPSEIGEMMAQIAERLGPIDILVNNAGIQHVSPIEDLAEEKWNAVIAVNLSAAFHATKAVLPGMKARRWGRIINIASAHGLVASPFKSAYVAAKHGIAGLIKTVALEGAEFGITANAICPGWVLTPLVEKQIKARAERAGRSEAEERVALLAEKQPMLEFSTPAQIGALAVFLCSDNAKTITGVPLSIDGGWTAA